MSALVGTLGYFSIKTISEDGLVIFEDVALPILYAQEAETYALELENELRDVLLVKVKEEKKKFTDHIMELEKLVMSTVEKHKAATTTAKSREMMAGFVSKHREYMSKVVRIIKLDM